MMCIALVFLLSSAAWAEPLPPYSFEAPPPPCENSQISITEECPDGKSSGIAWAAFANELYMARSELFLTGPANAAHAVHLLLQRATSNFSNAFECLPALMSTYFSLAHLLILQDRKRRALAMLQLGFIFVRDRGFSECTPWPVQGADMMLSGQALTARVHALDRESMLDVPKTYREPDLKVAIVTICAYAPEEAVRNICKENRQLYSALHGYDVIFFTDASEIEPNRDTDMDVNDGVHKPFFWKVNAVKNVMDRGLHDWVLWMDCDAFFMDPERTIDSVISMYTDNQTAATKLPPEREGETESLASLRQRIHPHPSTEVSLVFAVDSTGINNGVWLLRNSKWSHDFLARWWHSDILQGPGKEHNCSDQSTMVHTLLQHEALAMDSDWDAVEAPIWPPEVRVAAQEHLQSFHQATAESAMSRAWEDGDFIKHHPGCHYYRLPCQYLYSEAEGIFRDKVLALQSRLHLQAGLARPLRSPR